MTADRSRVLVLVLAAGLATACDVNTPPTSSTVRSAFDATRYADPAEQTRFKAALKDAMVPHEVFVGADGKEYVRWKREHSAAVVRIDVQLFGDPLAPGRSLYLSEPRHGEFKKWLAKNDISFTTRVNRGLEYVVWEEADYAKVAQWEHFPRNQVDAVRGLSSNTTPHTDARDVPAPAKAAGARAGGRER